MVPLRGEKPEWVSDRLGIKRVMWRGGRGRQRVMFYCLARALPEMAHKLEGGTVYVTYNEHGVLDNFAASKTMMIFMNIRMTEAWLNNVSTVEYANNVVMAHFVARCSANWHLAGLFTLSTTLITGLDQR